ncbi:MAG: BlaI/MecI/CopY family transcriptional regulator [Clostridia bacterium]|nr:BlaI/MecI/CopY family transcriptional regulator [Clostridia bacterium]
MDETKLGAIESHFADIIWQHAPIASGELAKLALTELNWKRTTTYTVLKRLCERGLFENQNGTIVVKVSRDEFYARQSEKIVDESFSGSLPAFVAAFASRKKISEAELNELQAMIEQMRRGDA